MCLKLGTASPHEFWGALQTNPREAGTLHKRFHPMTWPTKYVLPYESLSQGSQLVVVSQDLWLGTQKNLLQPCVRAIPLVADLPLYCSSMAILATSVEVPEGPVPLVGSRSSMLDGNGWCSNNEVWTKINGRWATSHRLKMAKWIKMGWRFGLFEMTIIVICPHFLFLADFSLSS